MSWLVLKNKKTGELSLSSRRSREIYLEICLSQGTIIPSLVLKEFDSPEEASEYLIEMNRINEVIKYVLNKKD